MFIFMVKIYYKIYLELSVCIKYLAYCKGKYKY